MNQHTINSILVAVILANFAVVLAVLVTVLGYPWLGAAVGMVLASAGVVTIIKESVLPLTLELEQWRISYFRAQGDI